MSKNKSLLYKIRRKGQVLALALTSPEFVSKIYFRHLLGYKLNLDNPQTFNEKLQWLKLYYWPKHPKAIQCADKYAVRTHLKNVGEEHLLNEIYYVWDCVDDIMWESLPNQFVLKCNHGCGYNILCRDKNQLDEKQVKAQLKKWLHEDFSKFNAEPHYGKIPRKVICEKYLGNDITNYNIYCFHGQPIFLSVAGGLGDGVNEHLTYYNPDGTLASFKNRNYQTRKVALSPLLPEMLIIAQKLSEGFPMVRIDLFDIKGKIILSEMTFTPGGALIPFDSIEADYMLGSKLDINEILI